MLEMNKLSYVAVVAVMMGCGTQAAMAADPPSDLCSLLPASVLSQTLGKTFGDPKKTVAPRPFPNTNQGTDCNYAAGQKNVVLRVYADDSAAQATDLFARLKRFFGTGSTDVSVGDEAYRDANKALHVRKGRVRFMVGGSGTDDQIMAVAGSIAGQL